MMRIVGSLVAVMLLLAPVNAMLTPNMQATVLRAHNEARSKIKPTAANMQRMVWNPTLAMIAQEFSENCQWEPNDMRHSEAEMLFPLGVGENMALSYGSSAIINQNPVQFIRDWVDEGQYYNITLNTCEPGRICSHYTQMTSANTIAVGCGFHVCQELEFLGAVLPLAAFFVCNYGPQGPAVTQQTQPYMPGLPCSLCPVGRQLCMNNLCEIGIARAPPAIAYPADPLPYITRAPLPQPTQYPYVPPSGGAPQLIIETGTPVPTVQVHTSPVGVVLTDAPFAPLPTEATMPVTEVRGLVGGQELNCTSPATILEREQCWLQAWTDWRRKFDSWVHSNCPGP